MQALGRNSSIARDFETEWWVGNTRLIDISGRLLGAHIAHAGLIVFWAGAITLLDISNLIPNVPLPEQNLLLLPRLANLGWGIGADGIVVDTYPYFVIGILHLISSAVLGAGGLYHTIRGPESLKDTPNFNYEWNDPKSLGFILGQHLVILGLGALLFVLKAVKYGGLYDTSVGSVHTVNPNLFPPRIFGYLFGITPHGWDPRGIAAVDNLPDLVGGHVWIAIICIAGGAWHILVPPNSWAKKQFVYNGDGILSYSLAGVGLMAIISSFFLSNPMVYPVEIFGGDHTTFILIQLLLGVTFLGGHVWHNFLGQSKEERLNEESYFSAMIAGVVMIALVITSFAISVAS
ncbi:MAG: chlorophyll a/b binding light-harvesting protein [Cyanobacteria bacterium P01_F01_bin.150]